MTHNDAHTLEAKATAFFTRLLSEVIKYPADRIDARAAFDGLGLDSVMMMRMTDELEAVFGSLPKTLFFEFRDIRALTRHFLATHGPELAGYLGEEPDSGPADAPAAPAPARTRGGDTAPGRATFARKPIRTGKWSTRFDEPRALPAVQPPAASPSAPPQGPAAGLDIAIIGLAGRYPKARTPDELWENLAAGRDCVTEIPADRWDHSVYYDADVDAPGKTYSKWGGFIDGVDEFDSLFFHISPPEAKLMDPQERLFLQCAYEAVEDAGYTPERLNTRPADGARTRVGVYVGVMYEEYQLYGAQEQVLGNSVALSGNPSAVANRVSYFFDFHGPSMSVDTMCSSSFTAIHLACQSIESGACDLAIAGGVNLSVHPNKYLMLGQGRFVSSKGRCESFGEGGDGYVPGEGVGAVLLKPLAQAVRDGDHIHGVIKGIAVNHGGRTNGYSVPSPRAQAESISDAWRQSGIDPRALSYIEAHGTGTLLGDPVEIAGLTRAFREHTRDSQFCAIGSVKSNIGHAESAAGISGLTKVLLQMKHGQLVPSLHSAELNPNIDFESSPFSVQQTLAEWKRPVLADGDGEREFPRLAGISSFGAGGSNAHLVVEEFRAATPAARPAEAPVAVVLSARGAERLRARAADLADWIETRKLTSDDLPSLAYTSQVGREAMRERLGIVTDSTAELLTRLRDFVAGAEDGLARGRAVQGSGSRADDAASGDVVSGDPAELVARWVRGAAVDWSVLHGDRTPPRIALPTYPFARERHWIDTSATARAVRQAAPGAAPGALVFEEFWEPVGAPARQHTGPRTLVCLCSDPAHQAELERAAGESDPEVTLVFVSRTPDSEDVPRRRWAVDAPEQADWIRVFGEIHERFGPVDGVLHLWPVEEGIGPRSSTDTVHLLQAVAAAELGVRRVLQAGAFRDGAERAYAESWMGFERSLGQVLPAVGFAAVIEDARGTSARTTMTDWFARLSAELAESASTLYRAGTRHLSRVRPLAAEAGMDRLKQGGSYLITGGLGALGLLFAEHLARTRSARLVLTGRSPLDADRARRIARIEALGGEVHYERADVTDRRAMREVVRAAHERFGGIDGVIHAAGVPGTGSVLASDARAFPGLLAAKVDGTLVLDEVLADEPLDFVCYFSSTSALLGDFGSCDYAVGNRFQTLYARHRAERVRQGTRSGATVAINWPLWRDGEMGFGDARATELYLGSTGQRLLENADGIRLFERLIGQGVPQGLVLAGEPRRLHRLLGIDAGPAEVAVSAVPAVSAMPAVSAASAVSAVPERPGTPVAATGAAPVAGPDRECLTARVLSDLETLIVETIRVPRDQIHADENLAQLGFDSITLVRLANAMTAHFGVDIVPSVFFSHPTPETLVAHLVSEQRDHLNHRYPAEPAAEPTAVAEAAVAPAPAENRPETAVPAPPSPDAGPEPIAVIGMTGRFPAARSVDEFWRILVDGRDVLSAVHEDRRPDWSDPQAPDPATARCGFVPGIGEFDPAFFEISPREARTMDPRQRLLLQEAWHVLEAAGYGERRLRDERIGMFVGAEQGDYLHLNGGEGTITGHHEAILASRLGYLLDFTGPVLSVNTACSSGLVAAHQACASLRNGECDAAIVAGVNLAATSRVFAETSKAGMLSGNGVCYAFDRRADGMVLGEAITVVMFKRLARAEADGDNILAVIRGSGINYDGRTNGITAPNGAAQARLYRDVYERHRIEPEHIGHVVAHGTGTRLGDPVEVNALNEVFSEYTDRTGFCALTSTKPNVGHTLAASGIVSLIALVQSLRHGVIPPSLHCEQDSDYIAWRRSPFYVNKALRAWPESPAGTRLGAVSSFGMSGTNVHMVVESHRGHAPAARVARPAEAPARLLVLSAKTAESLRERVRELREVLRIADRDTISLTDVSHTLLERRHHFDHRCALVVGDLDEAVSVLGAAERDEQHPGLHRGVVPGDRRDRPRDGDGEALSGRLAPADTAEYRDVLLALAGLYCQGASPDWRALFADDAPRLAALPDYPFSRKVYWVSHENPAPRRPVASAAVPPSAAAAEPAPEEPVRAVDARRRVTLRNPAATPTPPVSSAAKPTNVRLTDLGEGSATPAGPVSEAPPPAEPVAAPEPAAAPADAVPPPAVSELRQELRGGLADVLQMPEDDIDPGRNFMDLGLDSILGVEWVKAINKRYGTNLTATKLYDHPTVRELASVVQGELATSAPAKAAPAKPVPTKPAAVEAAPAPAVEPAATPAPDRPRISKSALLEGVRTSLADVLFLDAADIAADRNFVELGMDSIVGVEWVKTLNKNYGTSLTATQLYDHPTVRSLTDFLVTLVPVPPAPAVATPDEATAPVARIEPVVADEPAPATSAPTAPAPTAPAADKVAVVGMSGRYPEAADLHAYWDNLRGGRDCVTEVPPSRWDVSRHYDPRPGQEGKTYSKWLGYLADADCFDPLFFNISPLEAEGLDPQHRLFLQEAYRAFEDAGYDPQSLSSQRCGVYLGISGSEYSFLVFGGDGVSTSATSSSNAIAASRIAYFLNLKGPAVAVDTACSSSLVALHLARQALLSGEIDMALVGGVSLYLLPDTYVGMCQAGMLSPQGRCRSFDNGADGFVPGEGVGTLVLKRLGDAEADRDHIHGVVAASGINQDGRTNGITAPSSASQMDLVRTVYDRHGIDPATIGYVEMHGTGTKLGDPIELSALGTVYGELGVSARSCAIGSVKSNIGHTSEAAGVAGVHKVLLSMRHGTLAPSLNFDTPNEHFDFENSPFRVVTAPEPWETPSGDRPRRAAVSSFGFSGTNAHVVLEEYRAAESGAPAASGPVVIALSARTGEHLDGVVENLLARVEAEPRPGLAALAHTLQVGREAMEERLAFVAGSLPEVVRGLRAHLDRAGDGLLVRGRVTQDQLARQEDDERQRALVRAWLADRDLRRLAEAWVDGCAVDWPALHRGPAPLRLPLPTYPFAKERYWVEPGPRAASTPTAVLHPLLHRNTSGFAAQRYTSTFTGEEDFLADHRVRGRKVLPGAAYLELALAAVADATGPARPAGLALTDVVWSRPFPLGDQPRDLRITLWRDGARTTRFEVSAPDISGGDGGGDDDATAPIVSQGAVEPLTEVAVDDIDLARLRGECRTRELDAAGVYAAFQAAGIEYGDSFRCVERVLVGDGQALARLALPAAAQGSWDGYQLHPGLMDAALQTTLGVLWNDAGASGPLLPYAVDRVEVFGPLERTMWVWVRADADGPSDGSAHRLDLDLCDDTGRVRVRVRGFSVRAALGGAAEDTGILLFPRWQRQELPEPARRTGGRRRALVCVEQGVLADAMASDPTCEVLVLTSRATTADGRYADYALQVFERTKAVLRDEPRDETLVQVVVADRPAAAVLSGLVALVWTAHQENPGISGQLVVVDDDGEVAALRARLAAERLRPEDAMVRYRGGRREVVAWDEDRAADQPCSPWRTGGVYLITGGLGGLGRIFAEEIAGQVDDVTLVLTGRSPETERSRQFLAGLRESGARVSYARLDVTDRAGVEALVEATVRDAGRLDGVIHSAGVKEDNFILKKSREEFARVLPPKVSGTVNLDEATRDLDLDFFVTFSSGAAVTGNMGQADYVAANAFMDAFAEYRQHLVALGERRGRTVSINWSLWAEGGMRPDATSEAMLRERFGITPLRREAGLEAFARCLRTSHHQVLVVAGDVAAFRSALKTQDPSEDTRAMSAENRAATPMPQDENGLEPAAVDYIKSLLAAVLKVPWQRIEADLPMERYGIDSVMALTMTSRLEDVFGRLPKTLFFEYQNITALAGYFLGAHEARLRELLGADATAPAAASAAVGSAAAGAAVAGSPVAASAAGGSAAVVPPSADIAIVGLGGRYPQAGNLREFWRNLSEGRDSITEIPRDRWDHSAYFDADGSKPGKTYCKWGGFLDDIDRFDPQFFNISPREAEVIDPQERLFLECVYETLQDAGYTRRDLREYRSNGVEGSVGLFVGVMYDEYQLYGAGEQGLERGQVIPGNSASIANRVSYFCDWHGPSLTVKTMCSSSLTALHLACQSLRLGDCEVAVAGGVNLSLHPAKYLLLGQTGFASSRGMCESFGSGGDGYVPGEGVGAVLLKPLDRAIADNDRIYGVIKSTAINHGGRTNGYTVPNPNAQAATIASALDKAGVDARAVSYVEAHGTGTELGDPIEIAGLTKAFSRDTDDRQFCSIGSVKSNIGHCESAAGISALTKVLLQLKHRRLVPSLHAEVLNPHIDFADTPFRVQRESSEWKRPTVTTADGEVREHPLIAGISSFGAGGSNAHVVVSEYVPADTAAPEPPVEPLSSVVAVSARTAEQLREYAQRLLDWAEEEQIDDADLPDIAYTLQVGREHMDERLAFLAGSAAEFVAGLRAHVEGGEAAGLYRGRAQRSTAAVSSLFEDEDLTGVVDVWLRKGKLGKLMELWVSGLSLDWRGCYATPRRRVSLPTYPLARKRSWLPGSTPRDGAVDTPPRAVPNTPAVVEEEPEKKTAGPPPTPAAVGAAVAAKPRGIGLAPLSGAAEAPKTPKPPKTPKTPETVKAQAPVRRSVPSVTLTAMDAAPEGTTERAPARPVAPVAAQDPAPGPDEETLVAELTTLLARALYLTEEEIDPEANFTDLGLDSIVGVEWIKAINKQYGLDLAATRLYDTPTIAGLAAHLQTSLPTSPRRPRVRAEPPADTTADDDAEVAVTAVAEVEPALDEEEVRAELLSSLAEALYLSVDELDLDGNFTDFGLDSIVGVEWIKVINRRYGIALQVTKLYDHPSVQELAACVVAEAGKTGALAPAPVRESVPAPARTPVHESAPVSELAVERASAVAPEPAVVPAPSRARPAAPADAIAVVGMAGKYPLADNLEDYWDNLASGRDCVRRIPESRWDVTAYYDPRPNQPGKAYCTRMGLLDDVDVFDPLFFGIPPAEAEAMDPQQRLFLQEAYHAFEDAGYDVQALNGQKCGVYLGIMSNEYGALMRERGGDASSATSNSNAITAARLAYFLNLRGPAIALDTACSSSLVGTHLATQALRGGEIDMALVGGVTLYLTAESYISMCGAGMLAPDGRCKTFDNAADGFVPGEGVGALVLKRLADAERDGDTIHGVIRGSGINQDGRTNGITAPNAASQRELERDVYERYGVDPGGISYVEMHGTGTKLGDPIELEALASVYREKTDRVGYCAIGSVKSNVGHTSAAAGVAAIQKTLLCMRNRQLVPTLNFNTPNEHFDFESSPFYVNTELAPWKVGQGEARRAAVSSFGFSGTNAHLVLEEYDGGEEDAEPVANAGTSVFVLSAKGEEQLRTVAERIGEHVRAHPSVHLRNLAYSLQTGREPMTWRLAFTAATHGEFMAKVTRYLDGGPAEGLFTGWVRSRRGKEASAAGKDAVRPAGGVLTTAEDEELADRWVRGVPVDWRLLYPQGAPRRVPLPTYPFARERYWVGPPAEATKAAETAEATKAVEAAEATKAAAGDTSGTSVLLRPVWDAVPKPETETTASPAGRVVVIGGHEQWERLRSGLPGAERFPVDGTDTVETLTERLRAQDGPIDHLIWAAPAGAAPEADDALIEAQEGGLYACFRTLKALLRSGYGKRPLEVTVLTERTQRVRRGDQVDPTHSGVHGLMGSVANEYPLWNVRLVDLEDGSDPPLAEVLALPTTDPGSVWARRRKRWYRQLLVPLQSTSQEPSDRPVYRRGGTYVVIGGAGGIGEAWTEHVIRAYGAQVIWIGRREEDASIREKLRRLGELGPAPDYVQADAADRRSLERAYEHIKRSHPVIHGVVHSAIVLSDQSIERMDEERFRSAVTAKIDTSVRTARVFGGEPLDFMLFFSSMNSFMKAPGQCNYVAGSVFEDAYAHSLTGAMSIPAKVMNWGYWGSVGVVATPEHQERMSRAGAGSIAPADGMSALDVLLGGAFEQLGLVKDKGEKA
nr:PulG [Streptomyces sp.]